jgi:hypothetical protein
MLLHGKSLVVYEPVAGAAQEQFHQKSSQAGKAAQENKRWRSPHDQNDKKFYYLPDIRRTDFKKAYSWCSAFNGSTRVARRAGRKLAANPRIMTVSTAPISVSGSNVATFAI